MDDGRQDLAYVAFMRLHQIGSPFKIRNPVEEEEKEKTEKPTTPAAPEPARPPPPVRQMEERERTYQPWIIQTRGAQRAGPAPWKKPREDIAMTKFAEGAADIMKQMQSQVIDTLGRSIATMTQSAAVYPPSPATKATAVWPPENKRLALPNP